MSVVFHLVMILQTMGTLGPTLLLVWVVDTCVSVYAGEWPQLSERDSWDLLAIQTSQWGAFENIGLLRVEGWH